MSLPGFSADWPAPPVVRTWQTVRAGGVSAGRYRSLNLGGHVGDAADAVTANRARLAAMLALPSAPVWLEQVHGTSIVDVDDGPPSGPADAAMTARAGTVLVIMTADCLPVLLCSRDGRRVAAAHAGWRGLAAGVLTRTVDALGEPPSGLIAWLGPAIGQDAFEVGAEVREAFRRADPEADVAFRPNARGRWQADLYQLARRQLAAAGVTAVFGGGLCTFTASDTFFSHRREAPCGRQATLIWRS